MKIRIKRVYEQPDEKDGKRILVDRLWPRGLTKEKAGVDLWLTQFTNVIEFVFVNLLKASSSRSFHTFSFHVQ